MENPLPTRTPVAEIVTAHVEHIRTAKTAKSAQTDIYYLRDVFGPICEALKITSRKVGPRSKKRPPKPGQDRRRRAQVIEAACFEHITTADISAFVSAQMQSRGLAPKTASAQHGRALGLHRLVEQDAVGFGHGLQAPFGDQFQTSLITVHSFLRVMWLALRQLAQA